MDTNNWRAARGVHYPGQAIDGEPLTATGMEGGDWRSRLLPDSRQRIVNTLMKTLMKHLPFSGQEGLEECLKNLAVRFEETMYTAATSQSDYAEKIALKMMTIEMESQNPMANRLQSNDASNRKHPQDAASQSMWSPIQDHAPQRAFPMISNESRGTTLDVPDHNCNMHSMENWSTQSMLQQQSQSFLTQQLQQPPQQPSIMHQQQTSMPQHQMLTTQEQQQQQLSRQQLNTTNMQQNPMIGPQNIIQQQKSMIALQQQQTISQQNNLPNMHQQQSTTQQSKLPSMHQQQLYLQTDLSGFQQQQMQLQQQLMSQIHSQPGQVQQQIVLQQQADASQRDMPQRVQISNPLLQQQTTIDQQKQLLQSQMGMLEVPITSVDSFTQTGNANGGDWQEVIYQKIKSMNEVYFPQLNDMYHRMAAKLQQHDALPQRAKNEQLGKQLRFINVMLKRLIIFLRTNKDEIQPAHMGKIVGVEKQIVNILSSNTPQESASSLQQGHLAQFHIHAMQQSQQEPPQISRIQQSEKTIYGVSSLSNAGNSVHHPTTTSLIPDQYAIGTLAMSVSPLLAEFNRADRTHGVSSTIASGNSNVAGQPVERLLKVIKSMSPKALSASVSDISSVVSMVDGTAGSAPGNGSQAAGGEDLVATTKCRLQAMNFFTRDGPTVAKKKYTGDMPSIVVSSTGSSNDSFRHLNGNESNGESTAASSIKRPRIEANYALEKELREINQKLIDTVVHISEDDVDPTVVAEGTIVKCFFHAVALIPNLKSQYASAQMSPILPLRLLIPDNYPNCSPILLDKFPVEVSNEYGDLSIEVKSRFSISLQTLEQPMSLGDIARTWDECARSVICEYVQSGGGTFSSEYGAWENCVSAALLNDEYLLQK